jgi:hypothetical protein
MAQFARLCSVYPDEPHVRVYTADTLISGVVAVTKQPKTFDGSKLSVWQVLVWANGYYELSTVFTAGLPANEDGLFERDDLAISSATNRVLALELYIKALLMGTGVPVPKDHDLVVLFDSIPDDLRQKIRRLFDELVTRMPVGARWAIHIHYGLGSKPDSVTPEEVKRASPSCDDSLDAMLERNRKGFVSSRYLFQDAKRNELGCFTYDHRLLAVLCRILCEGLELDMAGKQPGYKRHFEFDTFSD